MIEESIVRSTMLAEVIRRRNDVEARHLLEDFTDDLDYRDADDLRIGSVAWQHIISNRIKPHYVFAHPDVLRRHPKTSLYYRGMALLSQKRVQQNGVAVARWEDGTLSRTLSADKALKACRIYNAVISAIIEGAGSWRLQDGYRNILSTMGIGLDGMFRNHIGKIADGLVKDKICEWVVDKKLVMSQKDDTTFVFGDGTKMVFGSEPDILFSRNGNAIATIEIKGGRDPAGALERLGAMRKSFAETPVNCVNYLVAGVVTQEMQQRLDQMTVKVFKLDDLLSDDGWTRFVEELFHYDLRLVPQGS